MSRTREFTLILVLVFLLAVIAWQRSYMKEVAFAISRASDSDTETLASLFVRHVEQAKAAYIYDATDGIALYEKNADIAFPVASLTKLMTARVALENLGPDEIIAIASADLSAEGDTGLSSGEDWKLSDLLEVSLANSSNDGISAIARIYKEKTGENIVAAMNREATMLGMNSFSFQNATGLDESGFSPNIGSAKDVAKLFRMFYENYPSMFAYTTMNDSSVARESGKIYLVKNTNPYAEEMYGLVASKTGFTRSAGGNLATISFYGGHEILTVFLGGTFSGRFTETLELLKDARLILEQRYIYAQIEREILGKL